MPYPSTISTLANPSPTDKLSSPSHSTLHDNENNGITEIQTFVGTIPASAVGTLIYDIRSPDSNGGGHTQTANKGGTGQTSFNKGDILVAQSSSVLTKLAVGTTGQALVADSSQALGVKWGTTGAAPSVIAIATTSVYSVSSVRSYVVFEAIAGGGGSAGNGGGGAGGYGKSVVPVSSITSSILITVGSGGTVNNNGGNTTVGTFISCEGGFGTNGNAGGRGGSVAGAQEKISGGTGGTATSPIGVGGAGFFGGAGAFGAGAHSVNTASAVGGYVVITEY